MALGGGEFTQMDKVIPGVYINFKSSNTASLSNERGVATIPIILNWGANNEIIEVTQDNFISCAQKYFGYDYQSECLRPIREVLKNANTLYVYRVSKGTTASNSYATAKYGGTRGNDIKITIEASVDDLDKYVVTTILDYSIVDTQTVAEYSELENNDYVNFDTDATLEPTLALTLTGGMDASVTHSDYQLYLDKIEKYSFNAMGVATSDSVRKTLCSNFVERMRSEYGSKFQLVLYDFAGDYEGIVNVKNSENAVYWVTGAIAGCDINKSNCNKLCDSEYDIDVDFTQYELTEAIKNGEFVLHKVGDNIRVLEDINSLTSLTDEKNEIFQDNQSIRIIDQSAIDIVNVFISKYLGLINNNDDGRIALKSDICKLFELYQRIGAIENFSNSDITVELGNTKKEVIVTANLTLVNCMNKMYMTVNIA